MIEATTQTKKAITSLIKESLKLIFFGGKGGVGKTTTSCSLALAYAKEHPDKKVLLVSCDPAHSISDSLGEKIGSDPTPVSGFPNLEAREIDALKLFDSFDKENQKTITTILDRGTYLDPEDINEFVGLSLPGIDELMALLEIARIVEKNKYDLVIVDTAPAGHTLRLLELPKLLKSVIELLNLMQDKHRTMVKSLTRRYNQDKADEFIVNLANELSVLMKVLKDATLSSFVPVVIPEALSVDETKWLEKELIKLKIPIEFIVVNRVLEPNECNFIRRRSTLGQKYLKQIQSAFKTYSLYQAPLFTNQVRGKDMLLKYASSLKPYEPRAISNGQHGLTDERLFDLSKKKHNGFFTFNKNGNKLPDFLKLDKDLVLFAGKGGVGKTSMSAACGTYLASKHMDKKILVVSIDPAHSLSSSLDTKVGGEIKNISKGLYALEIDSVALFEDFKNEYIDEVKGFFEGLISCEGVKLQYDVEIIERLVSLSPPGLDELMALNRILEIQKEMDFDLIIIDSAPTGHLIRFLETPELATPWVKSFIKVLYKYRSVVQLDKTSKMLLDLSSDLRKVISKLKDTKQTELVAVTYPEGMVQDETKRLLTKLKKLGVSCQNIIVNMVIPKNTCEICVAIELDQKKSLAAFTHDCLLKDYNLIEVPLAPGEIKGSSALTELGRWLYE